MKYFATYEFSKRNVTFFLVRGSIFYFLQLEKKVAFLFENLYLMRNYLNFGEISW